MRAALQMAEQEEPRLYSKTQRAAVDVIEKEHRELHADLERWGAWNKERYQAGQASSLEGDFRGDGGWREAPRPIVSLPPDPRLAAIEQAVVRMLQDSTAAPMAETLKEFYCKRWALKTICWAHALQYEGLARWMYLCREAIRKELFVAGS